jgi:transcriptional regulator with GAF, ATPase, and Fis domain
MLTNMGADIITNPALARQRLLKAFEDAHGRRDEAARALGASVRSVYRWLNRLDAWDALDTLMEKKGYERIPGPPRTRDRMVAAIMEARGNLSRAARTLGLSQELLLDRVVELELHTRVDAALRAAGYPGLPATNLRKK